MSYIGLHTYARLFTDYAKDYCAGRSLRDIALDVMERDLDMPDLSVADEEGKGAPLVRIITALGAVIAAVTRYALIDKIVSSGNFGVLVDSEGQQFLKENGAYDFVDYATRCRDKSDDIAMKLRTTAASEDFKGNIGLLVHRVMRPIDLDNFDDWLSELLIYMLTMEKTIRSFDTVAETVIMTRNDGSEESTDKSQDLMKYLSDAIAASQAASAHPDWRASRMMAAEHHGIYAAAITVLLTEITGWSDYQLINKYGGNFYVPGESFFRGCMGGLTFAILEDRAGKKQKPIIPSLPMLRRAPWGFPITGLYSKMLSDHAEDVGEDSPFEQLSDPASTEDCIRRALYLPDLDDPEKPKQYSYDEIVKIDWITRDVESPIEFYTSLDKELNNAQAHTAGVLHGYWAYYKEEKKKEDGKRKD